MSLEVVLDSNHIADIKKFGEKFTKAGKTYSNFGSFGPDITRKESDQFANTINGKIGELAFKIFCEREFKINLEIDLEVWDGFTNCDGGQDIKTINGETPRAIVDIKQSKDRSVWLAVEKHKIDGSISKADAFVFVTTLQQCRFDPDIKKAVLPDSVKCSIEGFAYREDFYDKFNEPFFKYCKNEAFYTWNFVKKALENVHPELTSDRLSNSLYALKKKWDCQNDDIYMKVNLDAKTNIALPKYLLRKSKEEFEDFLFFLRDKEFQHRRDQIVRKK